MEVDEKLSKVCQKINCIFVEENLDAADKIHLQAQMLLKVYLQNKRADVDEAPLLKFMEEMYANLQEEGNILGYI